MSATLGVRRRGSGVAAHRTVSRGRRHFRVRKRISGTPHRPRLVVTRSLRHIVAQLVDDTQGRTLVSASTMHPSIRGTAGTKTALAAQVGTLVAEAAKAAGITKAVFDRGGNRYAGRVAALAAAARAAGLEL